MLKEKGVTVVIMNYYLHLGVLLCACVCMHISEKVSECGNISIGTCIRIWESVHGCVHKSMGCYKHVCKSM